MKNPSEKIYKISENCHFLVQQHILKTVRKARKYDLGLKKQLKTNLFENLVLKTA